MAQGDSHLLSCDVRSRDFDFPSIEYDWAWEALPEASLYNSERDIHPYSASMYSAAATSTGVETLERFRRRWAAHNHTPTDAEIQSVATLEDLPIPEVQAWFNTNLSMPRTLPSDELRGFSWLYARQEEDRLLDLVRLNGQKEILSAAWTSGEEEREHHNSLHFEGQDKRASRRRLLAGYQDDTVNSRLLERQSLPSIRYLDDEFPSILPEPGTSSARHPENDPFGFTSDTHCSGGDVYVCQYPELTFAARSEESSKGAHPTRQSRFRSSSPSSWSSQDVGSRYTCPICGSPTKRKSDFKRHLRLHAEDQKTSPQAATVASRPLRFGANKEKCILGCGFCWHAVTNASQWAGHVESHFESAQASKVPGWSVVNQIMSVLLHTWTLHELGTFVRSEKPDQPMLPIPLPPILEGLQHTDSSAMSVNIAIHACSALASNGVTREMLTSPVASFLISRLYDQGPIESPRRKPADPAAYHCTYGNCEKKFDRESELKKHQRQHFPRHECDSCGSKFAYPKDLKRHVISACSRDSREWRCPICAGMFKLRYNLSRHLDSQHSGARIDDYQDDEIRKVLPQGVPGIRDLRCTADVPSHSANRQHTALSTDKAVMNIADSELQFLDVTDESQQTRTRSPLPSSSPQRSYSMPKAPSTTWPSLQRQPDIRSQHCWLTGATQASPMKSSIAATRTPAQNSEATTTVSLSDVQNFGPLSTRQEQHIACPVESTRTSSASTQY